MALKPHRALPGPTDEPSEPTSEHNRPSPPASTPRHVAAAALAAPGRAGPRRAAPGRDAAGPRAHPSTMCPAPASGRYHRTPTRDPLARAPRPGPPAPRSTRRGCRRRRAHSMPCPGRSPRSTRRGCRHRCAHSIQSPGRSKSRHGRLALLPRSSCAAHSGCPRVNHSRVHLVHDRRPHEARDADQPFRSRCLSSCHCPLRLPRTSFTRETA